MIKSKDLVIILPLGGPVNVGWGSKETQFHGSMGKDAARMKDKVVNNCLLFFMYNDFYNI